MMIRSRSSIRTGSLSFLTAIVAFLPSQYAGAAVDFAPAVGYSVGVGGEGPISIVSADLDQDGGGTLDLATANFDTDNVSELVGFCDGTFNLHPDSPFALDAGTGQPISIVAGRLTGNTSPDLATANRSSDNASVLVRYSTWPL